MEPAEPTEPIEMSVLLQDVCFITRDPALCVTGCHLGWVRSKLRVRPLGTFENQDGRN